MAQTTAAAFDTEKARDGQQPILLLELQATGATSYLANKGVTVGGQAYTEQIVEGVEVELDASFDRSGDGTPRIGSVAIALANADDGGAPWSDILASRTLGNRRAILRQEYLTAAGSPLAIADTLTLADGTIRLAEDDLFTDTAFRLEIADGSPAWHQELGTPITAAAYAGAAAEVLGQIEPIIYGSVAKHRCIPVDIGARTTLSAAITGAASTIYLTDTSAFPASGSVYIDGDEIAYTGKTSTSLTGVSGIDAVHAYGVAVVEKQAAYDWLVAGHACKAINAVYVRRRGGGDADWVLVPAAEYTAYASGGGGIASKANVRFSGAKFLQRAVALSVASHGHSATAAHAHGYSAQATQVGSGSYPVTLTGPGNTTFTFTNLPGDTECVWQIVQSGFYYPTGGRVSYGSVLFDGGDSPPTVYTYSGSVGSDSFTIGLLGTGSWITIESFTRTVTYAPDTDDATATVNNNTATLSGQAIAEAVYDLEVAVDVDGYADDGSGTYTGTASALIVRPADVLRHIGGALLGWTLADRFDATTFNAARSAEATNGMRLDFALTEAIGSAALFERIRHQSGSAHVLTANGTYKRYVMPFSGSSLKTFTEADDLLEPITVGLTPLSELANLVGVRYAPDPWTGEPRGYTEASDATSQGTGNPPTPGYGVVARWILEADLLRDATAAAWARDAWLAYLKDQKYAVELAVKPAWIHLEPFDHVAVTSTRMPGDWTAKEFLILKLRKLLGRKAVSPAGGETADPAAVDDRILLTCREV